MPEVTLTGFLICRSLEEADRVSQLLPDHVAATRAEPGCLSFEVWRSTADPVRFAVREVFRDRASLDAHRERMKGTPWAVATEGVVRDHRVTEGPARNRPG